ncbi:type III-B CRISPR module RAMP protein Cmr4 [Streptomyces cyanogenus]|uniref:RAMP superfamily protein n=1 Tax=Streptomyces cyanogenus TaxID=80860 RepID=A0ABX7TWG6_STRCY|nr:type III-B CRISPR module RAMP protein Cmr4 [Streptomyces cyanogenus]QTD99988.1 RAMP superfamily protein [Streptomyces cyanogenus]
MSRAQHEWLLYLYAESPLHAGAADASGVIDLPIQREAGTGYPVVWGQSLKGALRQAARDGSWDHEVVEAVFGSDPPSFGRGDGNSGRDQGTSTAGLLSVGDAQLVALPVPTLQETFAWVTSDIALSRLARKHLALPEGVRPRLVPPERTQTGVALAADERWCGDSRDEVLGPLVVPLAQKPDPHVAAWARRIAEDAIGATEEFKPFADKLRKDLLVVDDGVMPDLNRDCTELVARVQLNSGKTVEQGPFYSEYLPAETLLAASLTLRGSDLSDLYADELRDLLHGRQIQVGGDETIGKGLVWCRLVGADRQEGEGTA